MPETLSQNCRRLSGTPETFSQNGLLVSAEFKERERNLSLFLFGGGYYFISNN